MSDELNAATNDYSNVTPDAARLLRALRIVSDEVDTLCHGGIIEVSMRNTNVMSFFKHWEHRAETAEAEVARLRAALNEIVGGAAPDHWVKQYQHCVDVALVALAPSQPPHSASDPIA